MEPGGTGTAATRDLPDGIQRRLADLRVVLFDFDGTVIDTVDLIKASFRHTIQRVLGRTLPDEVLIHNLGMPLAEQMRIFSPEKEEELIAVYREHNRAHHDGMVKEFPGVRDALERLRAAGLKLGLVTSKSRELTQRGMSLFDMKRLFDAAVHMEDTERHKPHPEPVAEALRRLKTDPAQAVFVGDSPHDIVAGNRAGAMTIAVLWGPFERQRLLAAGPDLAVESPEELVGALIGFGVGDGSTHEEPSG